MRWRSRYAARSSRAPRRAAPAALHPRTERTARRPPDRRSAHTCSRSLLCGRGFATGERSELRVARSVAERAERLTSKPAGEPAGDKPRDRLVELLARDAAEDRPRDRRGGAQASAQEDVVGLPAPALVIARCRALKADVADPVLCARVRAAVEVEAELGDVIPEAALDPLDECAEPSLRLRDGEVAVRFAGAGERARANVVRVEREADRRQLGDNALGLAVRDVSEHEVLLARDPHVCADAVGDAGDSDHLLSAHQPEMHRDADIGQAGLSLRMDADVVAEIAGGRQLEVR